MPIKASCNPVCSSSNFGQRIPGVSKSSTDLFKRIHCFPLVTPGLFPVFVQAFQTGLQLAFIGSIKDEIINKEELALQLLSYCQLFPISLSLSNSLIETIFYFTLFFDFYLFKKR